MGAGLRQNIGTNWGPQTWKTMTNSSPNKVYSSAASRSSVRVDADRERKAKDQVKEKRRRSKYQRIDDSVAARSAYGRHDGGISPGQVDDDIPSDVLEALKRGYYDTRVVVTGEEARNIEEATRGQSTCDEWMKERRKRLTASNVGSVAKMRKTTKRSKKVQTLLYSTFRGNKATQYGADNEDKVRQQYVADLVADGNNLELRECGIFISKSTPWLAASPDGVIYDRSNNTSVVGLLEIKCPYSARDISIDEAAKTSSFCLADNDMHKLKHRHDYYYQVQCQLYCVDCEWCDFVVKTGKDIHTQRIYRDRKWWEQEMGKLEQFYFDSLLAELAAPRFKKGGIREPSSQ